MERIVNYLEIPDEEKDQIPEQLLRLGFCPAYGKQRTLKREMEKSRKGSLPQYLFLFRGEELVGYAFLIGEGEHKNRVFPWWAVDNSDVLAPESAVRLLEEAVRLSTECGCSALADRLQKNLEYRNVHAGKAVKTADSKGKTRADWKKLPWMTIPEWQTVRQIHVLHREQDTTPLPDTDAPCNLHVLVRGRISLPPGDCILRLTADDSYQAWLDGTWLGQGSGLAYGSRYPYQEYEIAGGRTVTLALHLYYQGKITRSCTSGDGRFGLWAAFCQGERAVAACDESWRYQINRAYSGETVGYDTQFLENFDSRLWEEDWNRPGYDDGHWGCLTEAKWADYHLVRQEISPLERKRVEPVSRRPVPGGVQYDFGRERTGCFHATAQGLEGQQLILRYGEELDEAGRVRYEMRCNCHYEEKWTLKAGNNIFQPWEYKAFRYVEVLGEGKLRPEDVLAECHVTERFYPMEEELCTLECETDELGRIFELCKNTVRCGTQEAFLDCPSREKGQYLGDAIITARAHVWLTGKTDMLRKCIRDFIESSKVTPGLLAVAPGSLMQEIADFSLLFGALVLTDYDFTGDADFLRECYPTLAGMTDFYGQYGREDGLLENVAHAWNLVDWPENLRDNYDFALTRPVVGEGCHNVINALWYGALIMKEKVEGILGLPCDRASAAVGEAFRKVFYRPEQKLFADSEVSDHCSLHANLYAACFGLLPEEAVETYEALLLTPGRRCGIFPMYFALRGLGRIGRHETLYRLLTREDENGWRNMLREGATTCFEAWGKDQKWNTSLCHPWGSGAIPLIIEELAGIRPDPKEPDGYRFCPHLPEHVKDFKLKIPFYSAVFSWHCRQEAFVSPVL